MPKATSPRRQLIVFILLGLALVGGALRMWAPKPSVAYDMGNLLLALWVPVIGNVIAFLVRKGRQRMLRGRSFAPDAPFKAHLLVELTSVPAFQAAGDAELGGSGCVLVLDAEGFTARIASPLRQWLESSQPHGAGLQLLRPELALSRLPVGAVFGVLAGQTVVGTGRVQQVLP